MVFQYTSPLLCFLFLISSHRRPCIHAQILPIDNRILISVYAAGRLVNHAIVALDLYTRKSFLGVHGVTIRWPRTEGTAKQ